MEQAFFNASQFHQWLKRIHVEKNREQQSELYSKLSDHLSIIFKNWCNISIPEMLFLIIEILTPCSQNNLFYAIMRPESLQYMHPFSFVNLPLYVQKILASRKLENLPQFYKTYEIVLDQGFIVLPTPQFFFFTFMAESNKNRDSEWFENPSFLECLYTDPFLILFTQYLQNLDLDLIKFLAVLSEEYLIKDIANKESCAPSRHNCEMLLMACYILQKPSSLLLPSYRMLSINPESLIFLYQDSLYKYFKNLSLYWKEGYNSYSCYIVEIWMQILTPWKKSDVIESYLATDVFPSYALHKKEPDFTGEEAFWDDYIERFVLLYTEIFSHMMRLLCAEILFKPGDIDLLCRLSEIYIQDSEGFLFNGHINLRSLYQQSKNGQIPPNIEKTLNRLSLNRSVLYPFNDSNLRSTAENLIFKASSSGYRESAILKKNWSLLLGVRDHLISGTTTEQLKLRPKATRSLLSSWDKPLRSDEFWLLYIIAKYIAWGVDKVKKIETWPPSTDLRFFASITNIFFILLLGFSLSYLLY